MPGTTRSFLGDVQVIADIVEDKAADFVASKVVWAFDSQADPGVYQLQLTPLFHLKGRPKCPIADGNEASLILIHGGIVLSPIMSLSSTCRNNAASDVSAAKSRWASATTRILAQAARSISRPEPPANAPAKHG